MAEGKWIQGAIDKSHEGSLRAYFGIKEGDTIPQARLQALITKLESMKTRTVKESHLLKQANLAKTLKHF
jgi:hypothetical protein